MDNNRLGNLGDLFPGKDMKCRIRGCQNVIHVSGAEVIQNLARGKSSHSSKMCDECYARLQELSDKEVPCSTPGCEGTFVWDRFQQLEAERRAKPGEEPKPPHGFCDKCKENMGEFHDQERPCRLRGCKNTWIWTAREQMASGGKPPAPRLCNDCFKIYRELKDDYLPCRVKGCNNSVLWTKHQQLEHLRAGKSLDAPPARMCEDCFKKFQELKPIEMPCKIHGCKNTWTLSTYEQLEAIRNTPEGQEPVMPSRMCKDCFHFFSTAKDIEVPCRNKACKNTWVWNRSMQLAAHVHGNSRPMVKLCDECVKNLSQLKDEERPCCTQGCNGTWTYRAEEQLRDKCAMRDEPKRRCPTCLAFFQTHTPEQLVCASCGNTFNWSVQEQLACQLGVFVKPEKCPDCVRAEIAGIREPDVSKLIVSRPQFIIPTAGEWNADSAICDWPPRMNQATVARLTDSAVRVVCIGDEATLSLEPAEQSWPALLEAKLRERFADNGTLAVLNTGIRHCRTSQGLKRLLRDVTPFRPQLVIASFVFGDAILSQREAADADALALRLAQLSDDLDAFIAKVQETGSRLLFWLPNPVYPQLNEDVGYDPDAFRLWTERQTQFYDQVVNATRRCCEKHQIPVVDARSLFEVNGLHSAQKWMNGWAMHNEQGAAVIANWIAERIISARLLTPEDFIQPDEPEKPADEPAAATLAAAAVIAEPAAEPVAEPAAETAEPVAEPAAEPVAETAEPVAEPAAEPVAGAAAEPAAEPVKEPAAEPAAETAEPVAEPAAEPVAETAEPAAEPAAEPVAEPVAETAEPVATTEAPEAAESGEQPEK